MTTIRNTVFRLLPMALLSCPLTSHATQTTALLDIVPDGCWGFVAIDSIHAVDAKILGLLESLELEAVSPAELFTTRLKLGPAIPTNGPIGLLFMPAPTLDEFGQHVLLILPCADVEKWLSDFTTVKLDQNLWRSELVWGPTVVARRGGFAMLGTSEEAVRAVLGAKNSVAHRFSGKRQTDYGAHAINIWVNWAALTDSPAGTAWLESLRPLAERATFGSSLLNSPAAWYGQMDGLHAGIHIDTAGVRVSGSVTARAGSALANLMASDAQVTVAPLRALPDVPTIAATSMALAPRQVSALAAEIDQLLNTPAISAATQPALWTQLRDEIQQLTASTQAVHGSIAAVPQSPDGVLAILATLQVADANAWIDGLERACSVLQGALFKDPALNTVYKTVRFERRSDVIDTTAVALLEIERHVKAGPRTKKSKGLDYGQALGGQTLNIRLAAASPTTVALCIGGHPREMGRLMAAARGQDNSLAEAEALKAIHGQLQAPGSACAVFAPGPMIHMARTLARAQDRVMQAPPRMPLAGAACAVRWQYEHPHLTFSGTIPTEVGRGLKALFWNKPGASGPRQ